MDFAHTLGRIPLWAFFALTILISLLAVEAGFRLGRWRRLHSQREHEAPVGSMVTAALGLLAFMLAFTFGIAESRFETRRHLVVDDANAIGTAFLRADFLAEPHRTEVKNLLREYVAVRVEPALHPEDTEQAVARSEQLQDALWARATAESREHPDSDVVGLFIQSLNEVIDVHGKRIAARFRSHVSVSNWLVLGIVAMLSMVATGYHTGVSGPRSATATVAIVFAFSVVILLVADLDRPQEGLTSVSQQPLIDLQDQLTASTP